MVRRLWAAAWLLCIAACTHQSPTAYDTELAQVQQDIAALKSDSPAAAIARAHALYRRASLSARIADARAADTAVENALRTFGPLQDLFMLRARLDFALHRLPQARANLHLAGVPTASPQVKALMADIDLQEGRQQDAQQQYETTLHTHRTWDNLARLANVLAMNGNFTRADALYHEAENEVTAKEMRAYAWICVQRGVLAFKRGRHDEALAHYLRAGKAYSGYWLVDEHIAELYGAQRRFGEAIALYEQVIARAPRPEQFQAIGDLYVFMGQPDRARPWHDKALAAYLESAQRGEVHYFHHLAGFYADVRDDGAEAAKWARKDLALRQNPATRDALAWALYRSGRFDEALAEMGQVLASGVQDAHVLMHAAMIHSAAGHSEQGTRFLQQAAALNPSFEAFHVHR